MIPEKEPISHIISHNNRGILLAPAISIQSLSALLNMRFFDSLLSWSNRSMLHDAVSNGATP